MTRSDSITYEWRVQHVWVARLGLLSLGGGR